jgi:cytidyltransferase-like protein
MDTIYLNPNNLAHWQKKARPSVIALGFFDGVHKGHREVIQTALQKAKENNVSLTVMSFFPHPKTVLSNGKERVDYLMPLSEKEKVLQTLGVDTFYIVEFDKEFAALSPEKFVAKYLLNFGVVHAVAGFDFSYGCRGVGHMNRLNSDSGGRIDVTKVGKVECQGEKISSTCIRERLLKGNVEELPHYLGRPYKVECDWDGELLTLHPNYTLPACGRYAVTLKNEIRSMQTEVIVQEGQFLTCMADIPSLMAGRLSIMWHRRIREERRSILWHRHIREDHVQIHNENTNLLVF